MVSRRVLTVAAGLTAALWQISPALWAAHSLPEWCKACQVREHDPALRGLIAPGTRIELVSAGYRWVEGPVWYGRALLFSDIPANRIYRWQPPGEVTVFLEPSGYSGTAPFGGAEPGANGLTRDPEGRLVICEHGDRRITRLEADGSRTVLADRYQGRRLNSPNDAVYHASGDLYFTDPPFGLPGQFDDPGRELDFSGIYRVTPDGSVELLSRALKAPNGLAFSPDGRELYVTDVDPARPAWLAFPVAADGRLGEPRMLRDARAESGPGRGAPDGLKVDHSGHLFGAGPGGVFVLSPTGALLGTLELGVPTSNVAWGDDGSTLYITADTALYRVRTATSAAPTGGSVP